MKKFYSHSDSRHGWLAVKVKDVEISGVLSEISEFSYIKGKTLYLEENRDMGLFLRTLNENDYKIIPAKFYNNSPIRKYHRFTKDILNYTINMLDTLRYL